MITSSILSFLVIMALYGLTYAVGYLHGKTEEREKRDEEMLMLNGKMGELRGKIGEIQTKEQKEDMIGDF